MIQHSDFPTLPRTLLLSIFILSGAARTFADDAPLLVAHRLGETRYLGWTYGSDPAKRQVNCVQFVAAVLEKLLVRRLTSLETDAVYIRGVDGKALDKLIVDEDERIKGVQYALTYVLKRGIKVEPFAAQSGDFIQYWSDVTQLTGAQR